MTSIQEACRVSRLARVAALAFAVLLPGCRSEKNAAPTTIVVAAAANLTNVSPTLGREFESQTGIHATFSFASTAQLTSQIENGAPFDVFLAADAAHVDELDKKHLLVPGSSAIYAQGILALWAPAGSGAIKSLEDLAGLDVRVIALAKPELAPYGEAAREALQKAGIWDRVESKIVYADNVNGAKQYGASRNADAVLLPYSLVLKEAGTVIQIPDSQHQPIVQKLGIPASSAHVSDARKFADFALHGKGQEIFLSNGYRAPEF